MEDKDEKRGWKEKPSRLGGAPLNNKVRGGKGGTDQQTLESSFEKQNLVELKGCTLTQAKERSSKY